MLSLPFLDEEKTGSSDLFLQARKHLGLQGSSLTDKYFKVQGFFRKHFCRSEGRASDTVDLRWASLFAAAVGAPGWVWAQNGGHGPWCWLVVATAWEDSHILSMRRVSTAESGESPMHWVCTHTGTILAAKIAPRTSVSPWGSRKVLTSITLISGIKPSQHSNKQFELHRIMIFKNVVVKSTLCIFNLLFN